MAEEKVSEVDAEIAGQKLTIKSASLGTIATVVGLVGVGVLVWQGYTHSQESRDASAAFVSAIKEQTVAMKDQTAVQREANCLVVFKDSEQCRRFSR
jgi:hypothetical protein